jgi:hypothetical protein
VDLDESVYEGDHIDSDNGSMLLRLLASTSCKWRTLKLLRCLQLLNLLVDLNEIVFEDDNINSDSDSMLFRLVVSTIPIWRNI